MAMNTVNSSSNLSQPNWSDAVIKKKIIKNKILEQIDRIVFNFHRYIVCMIILNTFIHTIRHSVCKKSISLVDPNVTLSFVALCY